MAQGSQGASFTERELDIMSVLWRLESGTVAEVREALERTLGYTTVLKMLQILEEKGAVRHESEGRAYRYFPVVDAAEAGGPALRRVVNKIFQGSAELVLARLVSDRSLSPGEIDRMRALLDEASEREEAGGSGKPGGADGGAGEGRSEDGNGSNGSHGNHGRTG